MPIRIVVPFDPGKLSLNTPMGWKARWRITNDAKDAATFAYRLAGSPRAEGRVRVSWIVRRGRVMDVDNLVTGLKGIRDVLFVGGITPADSATWIEEGGLTQETGKAWKLRPEVECVVEVLG